MGGGGLDVLSLLAATDQSVKLVGIQDPGPPLDTKEQTNTRAYIYVYIYITGDNETTTFYIKVVKAGTPCATSVP